MTTPSINPIYADVSTLKGRYVALAAGCELQIKEAADGGKWVDYNPRTTVPDLDNEWRIKPAAAPTQPSRDAVYQRLAALVHNAGKAPAATLNGMLDQLNEIVTDGIANAARLRLDLTQIINGVGAQPTASSDVFDLLRQVQSLMEKYHSAATDECRIMADAFAKQAVELAHKEEECAAITKQLDETSRNLAANRAYIAQVRKGEITDFPTESQMRIYRAACVLAQDYEKAAWWQGISDKVQAFDADRKHLDRAQALCAQLPEAVPGMSVLGTLCDAAEKYVKGQTPLGRPLTEVEVKLVDFLIGAFEKMKAAPKA